jgi:hypothetical protein
MFFILANCIGISYHTLFNACDSLKECELKQVVDLAQKKNDFLFIGISIVGVLVIFLTLFLLTIDSSLNFF